MLIAEYTYSRDRVNYLLDIFKVNFKTKVSTKVFIASNPWSEINPITLYVKYHNTIVFRFNGSYAWIAANGFFTRTTKARIKTCFDIMARHGFQQYAIYQRKGKWYIQNKSTTYEWIKCCPVYQHLINYKECENV